MKFISIVPTNYLHMIKNDDYFMCLAQVMIKNREYRHFYMDRVAEGKFVIMDNGAAEGESLDYESVIAVAKMVQPSELVISDAVCDAHKTLKRGEEFLDVLACSITSLPNTNLIAVPQGRNLSEWIACLKEMLQWPISTIGVSKFLIDCYVPRVSAVQEILDRVGTTYSIHLLGCGRTTLEPMYTETAFPDTVRSIDSAMPSILTKMGKVMSGEEVRAEYGINFDHEELDEPLLSNNITAWKGYGD